MIKPKLPKISIKLSQDSPKHVLLWTLDKLKSLLGVVSFLFLIFIVMFRKIWGTITRIPFIGKISVIEKPISGIIGKRILSLVDRLDQGQKNSVKRTYLIRLAIENIKVKKIRSLVTIGGMAVGIGAIVLLVSFGYGLERLVINKVASLNELKMIDVVLGQSANLTINDEVINKINGFKGVKEVLPIISVVGKVSIQDSVSEVIAYGVPKSFLEYTEVKKLKGELFAHANSYLSFNASYPKFGLVAGAYTGFEDGDFGEKTSSEKILFNIFPEDAVVVWQDCSINADVYGYTVRTEGGFTGTEWWGSEYFSVQGFGYEGLDKNNGSTLGKWIKASVPIYEKDAEGKLLPSLLDNGHQEWKEGCLTLDSLKINERIEFIEGEVLGVKAEATSSASTNTNTSTATGSASLDLLLEKDESTDSARISQLLSGLGEDEASGSGEVGWVDLEASESAKQAEIMIMEWKQEPTKEALVSTGMLRILGLSVNNAVGKTFQVSFVIVQSLIPEIEGRASSEEMEYKIVGVFEEDATSYFYVPFSDLRSLGISNYSQLKVISEHEHDTTSIREQIDTMGFQTTSTSDTVDEIKSIFSTVRMLLASLGLIALAVAALGMFNTLTVSLLERTREVGVMKAIGMKSEEVKQLFLAEAMIIGTSGGFIGLMFGVGFGKLLSLIVSIFSIAQGQGFLNLTFTPFFFSFFIFIFSFIVGVVTGIYPARRATKISALDALRYE